LQTGFELAEGQVPIWEERWPASLLEAAAVADEVSMTLLDWQDF
jgi:hypothetical protein